LGEGLVRTTALDVVMDLLLFVPEPGFQTFERLHGSTADVAEDIKTSIRKREERLSGILEDQREQEKDRVLALSSLELATVERSRIVSVARVVLARGDEGPDLVKACRETLAERNA
jgi:hypothetical protein